jgi:alpha-glucosidase
MADSSDAPWWQDAVIYQIYPRSFSDGDGDGVGDLPGATSRLAHLAELGVDAVWLSPFYRSPMADFGYDVSDHCDVDPLFGTLDDADALVAEAHRLGLRVVLDYVPNHTSERHPWFEASRSSRDDPMRDFYEWRDPAPGGGPPNNWRAAFADQPAWTLDEATGQYYLHLFLPEQPDLNWRNPAVVEAMSDVLRFWLARGVDGFRADVVHCIGKPAALPSAPAELAGLPACIFDHGPLTHERLRGLRRVVDGGRPGRALLVGETAVFDRAQQLSYLGHGDELHLGFNFLALHTPWDAAAWRSELEAAYAGHDAVGAWPTWVLSNHDVPRHATRYGSAARARAAAVLLLTLRGTPFLYQGEELGLNDAVVPPERVVDPGGRDGCRAPIPWSADPTGGWGPEAWLPPPPDAEARSVQAQAGDPASMLEHYRRLLALRRDLPVLRHGSIELLEAPPGVLRYRRSLPGAATGPAEVEVAVNFTDRRVRHAMAPGDELAGTAPPSGAVTAGDLADHDSGGGDSGDLGPDEARVVAVG